MINIHFGSIAKYVDLTYSQLYNKLMMKNLHSLTFITGNAHKARSVAKHLEFPIKHKKLDLVEIQSLDLHEVITFKAKEAYAQIKKPVLVEDTSFVFAALGRLPGTLIKWFEEMGNEKLCRMLDPYSDRSATVHISLGLYDGEELKIFTHAVHGTVSDKPRGEGLGWSPTFIPEGFKKTWAELTEEEREPISGRKKALKQLESFLKQHTETTFKI